MSVPDGVGAYESTQQQILQQLQSTTQYTDGSAAPAHPIGNEIVFNKAGTMTATSDTNPLPVSATVTPAANQRVNAQANDFLTGSIVDLLTLLTLAGTPTDANTVNSLMGRLTKIRDLLNATLSTKITDAGGTNQLGIDSGGRLTAILQAVAGTALAADQSSTKLCVSNYIKTATAGDTALTAGNTTMANSLPVTMASDQTPKTSGTATKTSVAAAASDTALLSSNSSRKGALFYNDGGAIMYLSYGSGAASTSSYTAQVPANGYFELPPEPIYTGAIRAIWSSATGNVRITELS